MVIEAVLNAPMEVAPAWVRKVDRAAVARFALGVWFVMVGITVMSGFGCLALRLTSGA